MTGSIASTSESLQIANALTLIATQKPGVTLPVVDAVWDDLLEEIKKLLQPLLDGVTSTITGVINSIKDTVTGIITPIVNGVSSAVTTVINTITGGIGDAINNFVTWLRDTISGISEWINGVIESVKGVVESVGNWIGDALANVGDWISGAVSGVVDSVGGWLAGVVDSVSTWLSDTYNNIKSAIEGTVTSIGQWVSDTYERIKEWLAGVYQTISGVVEGAQKTVVEAIASAILWVNTAKDNVVKFFWQTLSNVGAWFAREVMPRFANVTKAAEQLLSIFGKVWEAVSSGDYAKAFGIVDELFRGVGVPAPVATLHSIVSAIAYFWQTVSLQFIPMQVQAQKQAIINLQMEPLDNGSMAQGVYRGMASEADFSANAHLAGLAPGRAQIALQANRPLPTPGQIQQSFLRGEISVQEHDKLLSSYGFSHDNIELIKQLYLLIPGPSDLIRMAVREAFSPEIAKKFGQFEDYPKEFTQWAAKQGLTEEWAGRYWAAHWELPSATMGFEMLHRGVIDNDELKLLLRALDVMPYWRERLIEISYNPLTRVDIRRMYQLGVIDEKQVKRSYLDLGYDDQKAEWLKEFTIRYYTPEDTTEQDEFKALARGVYSQAYKKHVISESEYRQFLSGFKYHPDDIELLIQIDNFSIEQADKLFDLTSYRKDWQKVVLNAYDRGLLHANEVGPLLLDLGYEQSEIELELSLSDYNRSLAIRNMVANAVHEQYVSFIIDNVGLHMLLDQFNFTPEEIDRLQEEWDIERSLRTKRPPVTDLKKFMSAGLLTLEDYLNELRGEGYNERYIGMYATLLSKA